LPATSLPLAATSTTPPSPDARVLSNQQGDRRTNNCSPLACLAPFVIVAIVIYCIIKFSYPWFLLFILFNLWVSCDCFQIFICTFIT
jgi:hypothetical protein